MDFINAVKRTRKHLGISQAELSRSIGKTRSWINPCEMRRAGFRAKSKTEIAEALYGHVDRRIDFYQKKITELCRLKVDLIDALEDEVHAK